MDLLNFPIRLLGVLTAVAVSVRILCLAIDTSWDKWHGRPMRFLILILPRGLIFGMSWAVVLSVPHAGHLMLFSVAVLLFCDRSPFRK